VLHLTRGGGRCQPLTAPAVRPLTMYLCR
jgi:hypothetical protein